jgi:hypothetical protein
LFRDIKGFEGRYQINEFGEVKSLPRQKGSIFSKERILKQEENSAGYMRVTLAKDGRNKRPLIHRLVFETFGGKIPEGMTIHHRDENKHNNHIDNLMVATQRENNHYSRELKGYKLYQKDVDEIRRSTKTTKELAYQYGVNPRHILRIKNKEQWKDDKPIPCQASTEEGVETN